MLNGLTPGHCYLKIVLVYFVMYIEIFDVRTYTFKLCVKLGLFYTKSLFSLQLNCHGNSNFEM